MFIGSIVGAAAVRVSSLSAASSSAAGAALFLLDVRNVAARSNTIRAPGSARARVGDGIGKTAVGGGGGGGGSDGGGGDGGGGGVAVAARGGNTKMTRGVKKENLPSKMCVVCNRPFTWRKKWER
jgi:hypothetical protein